MRWGSIAVEATGIICLALGGLLFWGVVTAHWRCAEIGFFECLLFNIIVVKLGNLYGRIDKPKLKVRTHGSFK